MTSPDALQASDTCAGMRDRRVFDAVRELLAEQGVNMSMDALALRAGCSKQTLYSRYGNKHELIKRVMHEHLEPVSALLVPAGDDLREGLVAFALQHLRNLNRPEVMQSCLLASAAARNFPATGPELWSEGVAPLLDQLALWLERAVADGRLRRDDPHYMAELLLGMIVGLDFERQRFNTPHRVHAGDIGRWAEFAVDAFLRAFAPPAAGPLQDNKKRSTPR
ncbi:TetR/AcrR family transcriptional regulator [Xanthomonas massiliensis]|uniref:TetR/AcrR family transcriptional regulator n=1 Tax=Xanthomonas massiliensis TaxID=1720302 RepID=UPI0008257D51|nr:TetR/AcrR family transcriptional regulator [Xanthomonas massiliensis]